VSSEDRYSSRPPGQPGRLASRPGPVPPHAGGRRARAVVLNDEPVQARAAVIKEARHAARARWPLRYRSHHFVSRMRSAPERRLFARSPPECRPRSATGAVT